MFVYFITIITLKINKLPEKSLFWGFFCYHFVFTCHFVPCKISFIRRKEVTKFTMKFFFLIFWGFFDHLYMVTKKPLNRFFYRFFVIFGHFCDFLRQNFFEHFSFIHLSIFLNYFFMLLP